MALVGYFLFYGYGYFVHNFHYFNNLVLHIWKKKKNFYTTKCELFIIYSTRICKKTIYIDLY